jgi:hypothetical protein
MKTAGISLAALTLAAAITFAGQASAEKLKATLNGASEVPAKPARAPERSMRITIPRPKN